MLPNFKKSDKDVGASAQAGTQPPANIARPNPSRPLANQRNAPSVIGPDLTIMGNLVSRGEVQVDGEVQGDLHGSNVVVGERARITGSVIADQVVVRGHVMGSIRGKRVMLQATSHVEGDVFHQTLSIEKGAYFEGKSRRSEDPTAGAQQPDIPGQREADEAAAES